ncbi:MAG: hypothetical protein WED06_02215 [Candidatus Paceibacterota bacterium]
MYSHQTESNELAARGVEVGIYLAGLDRKLNPEDDGFFFWLPRDEKLNFKLEVRTPRLHSVRVIVVQGKSKKISSKKDETPESDIASYRRTIPTEEVVSAMEESYSTKPKNHNLRVVVIKDRTFELWEISIVTLIMGERANYHLVIQKTYSANMYRKDGRIHVSENEFPGYSTWSDLHNLLEEMVDVQTLDKFAGETVATKNGFELSGNIGRVIFFNLSNMWGFVQTAQGPAFLHWRQILDCEDFPMKEAGDIIEFEGLLNDSQERQRVLGVRSAIPVAAGG